MQKNLICLIKKVKEKLLSSERTDSKISFFNKKGKNDVFDIMEAKDSSNKIIINITDLTDKNIKKNLKFNKLNIKKVVSEETYNKKLLKENLNLKPEKEETHVDNAKKIDKLSKSGDLLKKTSDNFKKIVDAQNKTITSIKSFNSQKSDESKKPKKDEIINNNDNKTDINKIKESEINVNNIKTSLFKLEPNDENENENSSNSSKRSWKNLDSNYRHKLVFNSTIKENESEECSSKLHDYSNPSKKEEDIKSGANLGEKEKEKKRIDKLKKNLSKKKSLNPNMLNIMKLSSREDEIEDAKKRIKPVIYHFSQNNLNYARTLSKRLLKKKTKNNLQNKFDFIF